MAGWVEREEKGEDRRGEERRGEEREERREERRGDERQRGSHDPVGIGSLLFADDVVLLASSARDLQLSLDRFAAACEVAGMKISTSKSEAQLEKEEILPQVEEFKYLGVLFRSEGRMEQEVNRRIGAVSTVMWTLHRSVVVKRSSLLPSPMVMSFG
ncbi:hypothetical protein D4764_02G0004150 [Takifugu flavidus]|uniref:Reverse transcriptase domain-containing protein n=1 Tax=Takifugu flavidus TaxID=433684 RepID=A0A5C6NIU1_9TELE|nr:hypothetical protein D4764_02G0004150 [Takifugu flavidus]